MSTATTRTQTRAAKRPSKTEAAATRMGRALIILVNADVCTAYDATVAALTATPDADTPERRAVMNALKAGRHLEKIEEF